MDESQVTVNVHHRLVESGEYDRLSALLRQKLAASGWYDQMQELASENLKTQDTPNFEDLVNDLEQKALDIVPDDIKIELLTQIKKFLDDMVDN
ncbi:transcription factor e(y)2-domain-containing protein [Lipomyces oligophaga]|uniref:transcription factor e(y)2-domain-containing protein n=1 Tax=Lipomyces oligophaga TaxID=45792 RepID=UPI0034CD7353